MRTDEFNQGSNWTAKRRRRHDECHGQTLVDTAIWSRLAYDDDVRVFSGIQPSGMPHLGNYLGALKQWVSSQGPESFYCVVDLHALTLDIEPQTLNRQTHDTMALLLAAGLDPEQCTLFVQSHVPYHAMMNWLLECVASYGELTRMTQFKEKAERQAGFRAGLFTYPVLMAGDILLYQADEVPVGDDQRQHLELTREIAERFNNRFGPVFTLPKATPPAAAARVMDLQEPTRKMSKSVSSPLGTVYLSDGPDEIVKKMKKAVTDTDGEVRFDWDAKPGLSNLIEIFSACSGLTTTDICSRYSRYGDLKADTAQAVIEELRPVQLRLLELQANPEAVTRVMEIGAEKASTVARGTYTAAAAAMGLVPGRP
mgnify:CR=1 FL=1